MSLLAFTEWVGQNSLIDGARWPKCLSSILYCLRIMKVENEKLEVRQGEAERKEEDILVGPECRKCAWHLNRWAFCEIDSIAKA